MSHLKPPGIALWIASRFISEQYLEEFFGDLQEIYEDRVLRKGKLYAQLMYWVDVFHLLIGFLSPRIFKTSHNMMFSNMFKIAWRNAIRQKQFTLLNVFNVLSFVAFL